jgi:hypothetical protein
MLFINNLGKSGFLVCVYCLGIINEGYSESPGKIEENLQARNFLDAIATLRIRTKSDWNHTEQFVQKSRNESKFNYGRTMTMECDWSRHTRTASFISKGDSFVFTVEENVPKCKQRNDSSVAVWRNGVFNVTNRDTLYIDNGNWEGDELRHLHALTEPVFQSFAFIKPGHPCDTEVTPLPWIRQALEKNALGVKLLELIAGAGTGRILSSGYVHNDKRVASFRVEVQAHEKAFYMPEKIRYYQYTGQILRGETCVEEYKEIKIENTNFILGVPCKTQTKLYQPDGSESSSVTCEVQEITINGPVDDSEFEIINPLMFHQIVDRNTKTRIRTRP